MNDRSVILCIQDIAPFIKIIASLKCISLLPLWNIIWARDICGFFFFPLDVVFHCLESVFMSVWCYAIMIALYQIMKLQSCILLHYLFQLTLFGQITKLLLWFHSHFKIFLSLIKTSHWLCHGNYIPSADHFGQYEHFIDAIYFLKGDDFPLSLCPLHCLSSMFYEFHHQDTLFLWLNVFLDILFILISILNGFVSLSSVSGNSVLVFIQSFC